MKRLRVHTILHFADIIMEELQRTAISSAEFKSKIRLWYEDDTIVICSLRNNKLNEFTEHLINTKPTENKLNKTIPNLILKCQCT